MPTEENQFMVLDHIGITLNGIIKLQKALNLNKSLGPDNLGPYILNELAEDIPPPKVTGYRRST